MLGNSGGFFIAGSKFCVLRSFAGLKMKKLGDAGSLCSSRINEYFELGVFYVPGNRPTLA